MRALSRLFFNRRARAGLWVLRVVAPLRWLAARVIVRRGRRYVVSSMCEQLGVQGRACRRLDRRLRKAGPARSLQRRARRTVSRSLRRL